MFLYCTGIYKLKLYQYLLCCMLRILRCTKLYENYIPGIIYEYITTVQYIQNPLHTRIPSLEIRVQGPSAPPSSVRTRASVRTCPAARLPGERRQRKKTLPHYGV